MLAMTADPDPLADLIEAVAVGDRQALRGLFDRAGPVSYTHLTLPTNGLV